MEMAATQFLTLQLQAGLAILILMVATWLLSLALKDSSIVDMIWGLGFVIFCWVVFILTPGEKPIRHWLISLLVSIWGLRLSIHIFFRNKGKGEDFRYAKWRSENGKNWWWKSFYKVFLLQGVLMWIIAAPLTAAQVNPHLTRLTWFDIIGLFLWVIGFFFEFSGDLQLTRFKANPANKGKLLNTGVWKFSRHPNYFGDAAQWWGFYFIAFAAGGWWSIFSPILMTYLLVKVSGVALLEKTMLEKKPGYKEYAESTSAFIPWFPKNRSK